MGDNHQLSHVRRIFVRSPNWVGDMVMATASFARIRAAFPKAHITLAARPMLHPLLHGTQWFDEIVAAPRAQGVSGLFRQVRDLRSRACDLAIVLPNSLETGLVPFLARVPLRAGYRQGRRGLMNVGLTAAANRHWWQRRNGPRRVPEPMPVYYRKLLDELGLPRLSALDSAAGADDLHPQLVASEQDRQWVDDHLETLGIARSDKVVLLVVGANFGASKLWPPESFATAASQFEARGYRALITVGPGEVELGKRIAEAGKVVGLTDPVLPLDKLKAVVQRSVLVVTGDTGPRHLAVAFDRKVVCLMGPNDRRYTDYCTDDTALIQKTELECVPCQRKVCPLGHHRCMKDITVTEVIAAGERLLAATKVEA